MLDARNTKRSDLALGYLNVKLGCCRDLRPTDPKLSGNCYVEFALNHPPQKSSVSSSYTNLQNLSSAAHKNPKPVKARSTVHFGSDNPTWNETFFLKVHSRGQFLTVKLLDTVAETLIGFVEVNLDGFLDREDPVPIINAPFPLSKSPTEIDVISGTVELSIFFEPLKVSRLVLTVLDGFHLAASANVSLSGRVSVAGGHRKQKIRNVASGNGFPSWQETVHIDFDPREAVHHNVKIKLIESKASMYSPAVIGIAEIPMRDLMREQVEGAENDENKGFRKLQVLGVRGKPCGQLSVSAFLRKSPRGFNVRGSSPTTPILTRSASLASDSYTMNTSFPSTSNSSPRDLQSSPFSPDSDDPGRISPAPENRELPTLTPASSRLPIPGSEDKQRPSPEQKTPPSAEPRPSEQRAADTASRTPAPGHGRSPQEPTSATPQRKAFTLIRFKLTFHDLQLTVLKQQRDFAKKFQLEYLKALTLVANIRSEDVLVTGLPPPDSGPDKGCVIVETVLKLPETDVAVALIQTQLQERPCQLLSRSELRQYHVSAELLQRSSLHEDEAGQVIEAPPATPMVAGNGAVVAASDSMTSQPAAMAFPQLRVPLTSDQAQVLPQETRNGKPLWGPVEDMIDSEKDAKAARQTPGGPQSAASHSTNSMASATDAASATGGPQSAASHGTINSMVSATDAAHRAGAPGAAPAAGGPQSAASYSTINSMVSATDAAHRAGGPGAAPATAPLPTGVPGVTAASSTHQTRAVSAANTNAVPYSRAPSAAASSVHHATASSAVDAMHHTGALGTAVAPHHTRAQGVVATAAAHHSVASGAAAAVHQTGATLGSAAGAQVRGVPAPATPSEGGELPALMTSAERPVPNGFHGPASYPLPSTPPTTLIGMGYGGSTGLGAARAAAGPVDMRPGARSVTGAVRLSGRAAERGLCPPSPSPPSTSSLPSSLPEGMRQPQITSSPAPKTHHMNLMSPASREVDENCLMVFTIVFFNLKLFMLEDQEYGTYFRKEYIRCMAEDAGLDHSTVKIKSMTQDTRGVLVKTEVSTTGSEQADLLESMLRTSPESMLVSSSLLCDFRLKVDSVSRQRFGAPPEEIEATYIRKGTRISPPPNTEGGRTWTEPAELAEHISYSKSTANPKSPGISLGIFSFWNRLFDGDVDQRGESTPTPVAVPDPAAPEHCLQRANSSVNNDDAVSAANFEDAADSFSESPGPPLTDCSSFTERSKTEIAKPRASAPETAQLNMAKLELPGPETQDGHHVAFSLWIKELSLESLEQNQGYMSVFNSEFAKAVSAWAEVVPDAVHITELSTVVVQGGAWDGEKGDGTAGGATADIELATMLRAKLYAPVGAVEKLAKSLKKPGVTEDMFRTSLLLCSFSCMVRSVQGHIGSSPMKSPHPQPAETSPGPEAPRITTPATTLLKEERTAKASTSGSVPQSRDGSRVGSFARASNAPGQPSSDGQTDVPRYSDAPHAPSMQRTALEGQTKPAEAPQPSSAEEELRCMRKSMDELRRNTERSLELGASQAGLDEQMARMASLLNSLEQSNQANQALQDQYKKEIRDMQIQIDMLHHSKDKSNFCGLAPLFRSVKNHFSPRKSPPSRSPKTPNF